jgi:flagellar transcriptional activator FlhD
VLSDPCENATLSSTIAGDITELNLAYLLLAQRLLQQDYESARFRLGVSTGMADALLTLSATQTIRLAHCGSLICVARFDDPSLLDRLADEEADGALQRVRGVILLAGRNQPGV